ncbi:uncharacterized protein N7469_011520 [Penicillium citrinum]|uniref:Uncharacterized protein n=1 Tax=Penicillium citrinum TaxID=5077 RepID=A0A9W9TDU8_PENCI|nr:uncharacterized protein N7469_011520 [Penicillium citrinum]KAJ5217895.1 hypothetical protein N7469_011520 [Penicillium citrinum]
MYATAVVAFIVLYFLIIPVAQYFYDTKGLRKYHNFYSLSGIYDLPFVYEAQKGFRSRNLFEAHKKHPVLRIDIYGHGTDCIKDRFYSETGGTHAHLADVVGKKEHARKRKVLSSAYVVKNLEEWEFKVADVSGKLIKAFDKRCTTSLPSNTLPSEEDLNVDYRRWTVLFAAAAIANIGLSEDLGFLDEGSDFVKSESKDGTVKEVSFRECHGATGRVSYQLMWSYDWLKKFKRISKIFSLGYQRMWNLDGAD